MIYKVCNLNMKSVNKSLLNEQTFSLLLHGDNSSAGFHHQQPEQQEGHRHPKFSGFQKLNVNGNRRQVSNGHSSEPKKCRYCKKTGHMQKECRKRIKENGQMINAQGKPYGPRANEMVLHLPAAKATNVSASCQLALKSLRFEI